MPAPDIEKIVKDNLNELNRIKDRVLPVKVGRAAAESVKQNFRQGGFYGSRWKEPLRRDLGFEGAEGEYGPLLSRQDHLMSSTDSIPGTARVTIRNTAEYASVHNEGGSMTVTPKMKKYFWARFFRSSGERSGSAARKPATSREASFWKAMALKRAGSLIRIPRRRFLGESPQLTRLVSNIINKELKAFINGINSRKYH